MKSIALHKMSITSHLSGEIKHYLCKNYTSSLKIVTTFFNFTSTEAKNQARQINSLVPVFKTAMLGYICY